jgi:hypothetical protein
LGTGGYHFVYHVEGKEKRDSIRGHVVKMRYTPMQTAVSAVESQESPYHEKLRGYLNLMKRPVLLMELHSMLPLVVLLLRYWEKKEGWSNSGSMDLTYIHTDATALPIAFSRHVAALKQLGHINRTITEGHAYGGDVEAVNIFSALIAGCHVFHTDALIAGPGPGSVGTGTYWGHSGVSLGTLINAVGALEGEAVVVPRLSSADKRPRHFGISHHFITALREVALAPAMIPYPVDFCRKWPDSAGMLELVRESLEQLTRKSRAGHRLIPIDMNLNQLHRDLNEAMSAYPITIRTMLRGFTEDPFFFIGAAAASRYFWQRLRYDEETSIAAVKSDV